MTALERREEILHILITRREERLGYLANLFGVSKTTIRNDIDCLSMAYPIYTIRGNGGGIFIDKNYHPYKMSISRAQAEILATLEGMIDEKAWMIIEGLLKEYSPYYLLSG